MYKEAADKDVASGEGCIGTVLRTGPHPRSQLVEKIQQDDMEKLHSRQPIQTNCTETQTCASVLLFISHIGTPVQLAQRNAVARVSRSEVTMAMRRHTFMQGTMSGIKEEMKRSKLPIHHITVVDDWGRAMGWIILNIIMYQLMRTQCITPLLYQLACQNKSIMRR